MIVEFIKFANEWSEAAHHKVKSKGGLTPSLGDILKEWCPIVMVYRYTDPLSGEYYDLSHMHTRQGAVKNTLQTPDQAHPDL